tara:strand:- start:688 stop:909 length:222 start_codon:yes stop_codon:yes gene_type:complete
MTYYINIESTGLSSDDQVRHMADAMQADGYDVEFTRNFGSINSALKAEDLGITDQQWMNYVEAADAAVPSNDE